MSDTGFAKIQMIDRYKSLKRDIEKAETPKECAFGVHAKTLCILMCETQLYFLQQVDEVRSVKAFLFDFAKRSPLAFVLGCAVYVWGKNTGVF